ncbi:MAG: 2-phospho-L-lactate guanylyltransferase [Pseudomonadales bacterium]
MLATLVIPIKQLSNAKQRLSSMLDAQQRRDLCQAMLEDVLETTATCEYIEQVVVVTSDEQVSDIALSYGARILPEPENPGLIEAVRYASEVLAGEGVAIMAFLPGDTPLVNVEELDVVLGGMKATDEAEFLIVPASDLGGSNCVVCAPPNCMEFRFGEDSFRRHLSTARERGINPTVLKLPGIGLDVDTPEDLSELVNEIIKQNIESHTYRFLVQQGFLHIETAALAAAGTSKGEL